MQSTVAQLYFPESRFLNLHGLRMLPHKQQLSGQMNFKTTRFLPYLLLSKNSTPIVVPSTPPPPKIIIWNKFKSRKYKKLTDKQTDAGQKAIKIELKTIIRIDIYFKFWGLRSANFSSPETECQCLGVQL